MNLWIRSQNKKALIKVNELFIVKCYKDYMITDYPVDYPNDGVTDLGINLGTYKTKERALEVLDEIQEVLMPKIKVLQSVNAENNIDDLVSRPTIQECGKVELLQYSDYVYEMPKE